MGIKVTPFDLAGHSGPVLSVMTSALNLGTRGSQERAQIVLRHAERPGLITRGAFAGDRMIGFCYGFPSDEAAWWERQVRQHLLAASTVHWLDDGAFELTELHVCPDHQGRGLGRRLITEVLDAAELPRALLSVLVGDTPARHLYSSLGFRDLTTPFRFGAGQPPYVVMGVTLPVRPTPGDAPSRLAGADGP